MGEHRWNRYLGAEGALMLAFEEHGVPYQRHPFPFAVFRSVGRCFVLGQPPGIIEGCRRALAGLPPGLEADAAQRRCEIHTCCNSLGYCEDFGDSAFACRCRPLPQMDDADFGTWIFSAAKLVMTEHSSGNEGAAQ